MQYIILLSTLVVAPLLSDAIYDNVELGSDASMDDKVRLAILLIIFLGSMFYLFVSPMRNAHVRTLMFLYTISVLLIPSWGSISRDMKPADARAVQWTLIGLTIASMAIFIFYQERTKLQSFQRVAERRLGGAGYDVDEMRRNYKRAKNPFRKRDVVDRDCGVCEMLQSDSEFI